MLIKGLNLTDRAWLLAERHDMPLHVAGLAVFTPPAGAGENYLRELVAELRERTSCTPPFNRRLRQGAFRRSAPAWEVVEDGTVDLDYHLRHSALPRPGGERELGVLISRLHSRPLDITRPLWEVHIIEGLEGGRFAMYMKVHHSLMDGVAGMRRLTRMLSTDQDDRSCPPPWGVLTAVRDKRRRDRLNRAARMRRSARTARSVIATMGNVASDAIRRPDPGAATLFGAPRSVLNVPITQQRRVATQTFDLDRLKRVAHAAGGTVNDVFLTMCASALRRYLWELGQLPGENLTAVTPVSVRAEDDSSSGNAFSLVMVNLHTRTVGVRERFDAIHESSARAKAQLARLPKVVAENFGVLLLGPFLLQQIIRVAGHTRPPASVIVSNVPGPPEQLFFNGARLEHLYPVSLVSDGSALNITAVSASGRFNLGVVGCRDALPHLQRLAVYHGEALAELEAELGVGETDERSSSRG